MLEGVLMLLAYSLGLGIPFLLSAVLIDYLKFAFQWIKQHYRIINTACGVLLVLLGVLMATGTREPRTAPAARRTQARSSRSRSLPRTLQSMTETGMRSICPTMWGSPWS